MSDPLSRREFVRCAGRWAGAALIGGWLASVLLRDEPPDAGAPSRLCGHCPSLPGCRLPQGERARMALAVQRQASRVPPDAPRLCARPDGRPATETRGA